jgi:hypothetical protein
MSRSQHYQYTLPVVDGVIQDPQQTLTQLRAQCRADNQQQRRAYGRMRGPTRWVIELKYRGPRCGQPYNTPKDAAYAVDVYKRLRREWN